MTAPPPAPSSVPSPAQPSAQPPVRPKPGFEPEKMRAASGDASELMRSLGNRHRLLILCQLVEGEHSVGQLAEFLGIRDSTVSQHLALLRRERIVAGRRDGQTIWYRVESKVVRDVMQVLYDHFCNRDPHGRAGA